MSNPPRPDLLGALTEVPVMRNPYIDTGRMYGEIPPPCCFISEEGVHCKVAEDIYAIEWGGTPDDYTCSCAAHLGLMLQTCPIPTHVGKYIGLHPMPGSLKRMFAALDPDKANTPFERHMQDLLDVAVQSLGYVSPQTIVASHRPRRTTGDG